MYNDMVATLLPVQKPMLADRIERMDKVLQPGIETLKWNSDGINPFISNAMKIVSEINALVRKMKDNEEKILVTMATWTKPLYERKKTMDPDMVTNFHGATVEPRRDDIKQQGKEIHKLLRDTQDNIKPDKKGAVWLQYVDYVNGLLIEGITTAINSSMEYLCQQINIKENAVNMWQPIFEIKVDLIDRELQFQPVIGCNERGNGIRDIINNICNDFISIAIQIPRLDNKEGTSGDYLVEIKDQFQLFGTIQAISNQMTEIQNQASEFLDPYRKWDFLWQEDLSVSFKAFLDSGTDLKEIYMKQKQTEYAGEDEEEYQQKMRDAEYRFGYL